MKIKIGKNYFTNKRFWRCAFLAFFVFVIFFGVNIQEQGVSFLPEVVLGQDVPQISDEIINPSSTAAPGTTGGGWSLGNLFTGAINRFLLAIFSVLKWVFMAAGLLLDYAIDPKNISDIVDRPAIYEMWKIVRDFLNLSFILVLLYSAFCTIFQVETYHIKKIIITLVIMALLVNFSFPIARFIIDASNVMMYYFLNNVFGDMGGADSISGRLAGMSKVAEILIPPNASDGPTSQILMAIIFLFILLLTILVLAAMFVIRAIALALIIIFSPIGFVGNIMPGKMKSYADEWWTNLFSYAFFGPIMAFMLGISFKFMTELKSTEAGGAFGTIARDSNNFSDDPSGLANLAYFSIPIIVLWFGMMTAQKMKIAGADAVTGAASKAANWAKQLPWKAAKFGANATGIPGGVVQKYDNWKKTGFLGSSRIAQREAQFAAKGPFKVAGAMEQDMKKRAEEYKKNAESVSSLQSKCSAGDAAACYRLAEDKDMDQPTYDSFTKANKNAGIQKSINSKVKQNRADITTLNEVNNMTSADISSARADAVSKGVPGAATWTDDQVKDHTAEEKMGKMGAEKIADQDWVEISKRPTGPDKTRIINSMIASVNGLAPQARGELRKRLSSQQRKAINTMAGVTIV